MAETEPRDAGGAVNGLPAGHLVEPGNEEAIGRPAGDWLGSSFRLLMQIRIVLAIMSMLLVPYRQQTLAGITAVTGVALLSWLGLVGWRPIVAQLTANPVLIAIDVCASYGVLAEAGVRGPFFLFTVMTSVVAGLLYWWPGRILVCVLQVLVYYVAAVAAPRPVVDVQIFLVMPAFYPIAAFVGAGMRRLFDEYDRVNESRRQAQVIVAAADERSRLAREMHDSLAKTLRGIALSASALPMWMARSPERAEEEARRIAAAAEIASREARQLISDLREDLVQRPLATALGSVVDDWGREHGVHVTAAVAPEVDLPLRSRYELIAIVREALENVIRHADASSVEIRLTESAGAVRLCVQDDGSGFDAGDGSEALQDFSGFARKGHYGLIGMRERARVVGAELTVTSEPGLGTTVTVVLPVSGSHGHEDGAGARRLDAA